ncbi:NAD(P)-binding protein [Viridibacterium curvum]|uniref:NAD(P)/FAD-dependent oxidoreductase n=1 Tax=Viridibacterium curvum TaxID=1101404 RepID=A0ABP9QQJ8_9RHOO
MQRRHFLTTLGALSASSLTACEWGKGVLGRSTPPVTVLRTGMQQGHAARDLAMSTRPLPDPGETIHCDLAILGSGAAGITAAWKLAREGYRNFILLDGPVAGGNTAGEQLGGVPCPTAAHYLPLPSQDSIHVREMLASLGILRGDPNAVAPEYDENILVHPLHERLRSGGRWQDELLPHAGTPDQARFLATIATLREARGNDGRRVFVSPLALSSADPHWRALDALNFRDWLQREQYTDKHLHWYANYICRDEFGTGYTDISAWAGLHYFASRDGHAANAEAGSVLTWPDGLNSLAQGLLRQVPFGNDSSSDTTRPRRLAGSALRVREQGKQVEVLVMQAGPQGAPKFVCINAKRVICAMPLHIAQHVVEGIRDLGFHSEHLPRQAPWLVANFLLRRFPDEKGDVPLAWDNVLRESPALGYVVATHQLIRVAKPERTVFTTYNALAETTPDRARMWMKQASDSDVLAAAAQDLLAVYGKALWPLVEQVHIHLHAHAMASPTPGFLGNPGLQALRETDGRIRFAHADLSGYSVFEEAGWWGWRGAVRALG